MSKGSFKSEWQSVKVLMQRTLATEEHEKTWAAFELSTLLKFRCQAAAGCKIIVSIFLACFGTEAWQVAKKQFLDTTTNSEDSQVIE